MMTLAELKAAGQRAHQIECALERLADAEKRLALINKHGRPGMTWDVKILLCQGDRYGNGNIYGDASVPFGVVQQQAVYAVEAARRAVIRLGEEPPSPPQGAPS
jgi:hypothetical protein